LLMDAVSVTDPPLRAGSVANLVMWTVTFKARALARGSFATKSSMAEPAAGNHEPVG
jgi:hypothetical protein